MALPETMPCLTEPSLVLVEEPHSAVSLCTIYRHVLKC